MPVTARQRCVPDASCGAIVGRGAPTPCCPHCDTVPVMSHESGLEDLQRGAVEPRVPKSLIGMLIREFRLPPDAPGNKSLLGMIIREFRTAPEPARKWISALVSGVLVVVIGGLILFYMTPH